MDSRTPGVLVFAQSFDYKFRSLGNDADVYEQQYKYYKCRRYEQDGFNCNVHFFLSFFVALCFAFLLGLSRFAADALESGKRALKTVPAAIITESGDDLYLFYHIFFLKSMSGPTKP